MKRKIKRTGYLKTKLSTYKSILMRLEFTNVFRVPTINLAKLNLRKRKRITTVYIVLR